jgi:hypothetical protein
MATASWQRVSGTVIRGARRTSGIDRDTPYGGRSTLEWQMPLFKERGLDLSACFVGTLNMQITPATWSMVPSEPTFRDVRWYEGRSEDFFFSQCRLFFGGTMYSAWVYCASPGKPHPIRGPHLLEIIAEKIPGIQYGSHVEIELNPAEIRINEPK